jgi:hypothetical protein
MMIFLKVVKKKPDQESLLAKEHKALVINFIDATVFETISLLLK